MALLGDLRLDYARLNDPNYIKEMIARNQMLYRPELESSFKSLDADLNRRGLYSASPVTRSRYRATSEFNRGIAQMTEQQRMKQWETILPLLAQLELAEKEGKRLDKSGWLKAIGSILGTGAGFFLGGDKPWILGGGQSG